MKSSIKSLTRRPAWKALATHYKEMNDWHLRDLFADDAQRGERLTAEATLSRSGRNSSRRIVKNIRSWRPRLSRCKSASCLPAGIATFQSFPPIQRVSPVEMHRA